MDSDLNIDYCAWVIPNEITTSLFAFMPLNQVGLLTAWYQVFWPIRATKDMGKKVASGHFRFTSGKAFVPRLIPTSRLIKRLSIRDYFANSSLNTFQSSFRTKDWRIDFWCIEIPAKIFL